MRALGPQSVSSFLKVVLDVVYAVVCIGAAIIGPLGLAVLVYLPFTSSLHLQFNGHILVSPVPPLALAAVLMGAEVYIACLVVILNRLRRVMETLTLGDPFRPENVGRLRLIGAVLVALELSSYGVRAILAWTAPVRKLDAPSRDTWFNPTVWFAVLVVFVLAEVFREGARLRREAELTI